MVEWGVCGEGKEWEGLCVGMPSIARAAAGNDANPRPQPATSQTDNEHDASLRRRIPPLAALLPCHRHQVNRLGSFPAVDRAPAPACSPAGTGKNFSFPPPPAAPHRSFPKQAKERPPSQASLGRCRTEPAKSLLCDAEPGRSPSPAMRRSPSTPPSRPGLPHLAYCHHRHDAGTKI